MTFGLVVETGSECWSIGFWRVQVEVPSKGPPGIGLSVSRIRGLVG